MHAEGAGQKMHPVFYLAGVAEIPVIFYPRYTLKLNKVFSTFVEIIILGVILDYYLTMLKFMQFLSINYQAFVIWVSMWKKEFSSTLDAR